MMRFLRGMVGFYAVLIPELVDEARRWQVVVRRRT